jgi:CelD/BcsL family acetyltransferase involved in cellulose biosynthesis
MVAIDLDDREWHRFVSRSPDATPFHHPAWSNLLAETYGFRPFALVHQDDEGHIVEGLPVVEVANPFSRRRWVSLPFTDYCRPLTLGQELRMDFAHDLDVARRAAAVARVEVRAPVVGDGVHLQERALRHVLPLAVDDEEAMRAVHPHMRRNVGKAIREGVDVRHAEAESDVVDIFYGLHLRTRRRLGVPVQPRRYFQLLWRQFLEPGRGRLFLAYRGSHPIGGAIILAWNGSAIYKYGAWDERARRLRPNNLLFWRAIQWSIQNGATTLDLGRTDIDQPGLRLFKNRWGAREDTLTYSTIGSASAAPTRSSPRLVSYAIRHSPEPVCRALGEAFYRFAA